MYVKLSWKIIVRKIANGNDCIWKKSATKNITWNTIFCYSLLIQEVAAIISLYAKVVYINTMPRPPDKLQFLAYNTINHSADAANTGLSVKELVAEGITDSYVKADSSLCSFYR